jgi:osmoprotectant transport system permease protein
MKLIQQTIEFFIHNRHEVLTLTLQHLFLVVAGTGAAAIAGIPIGILLTRRPALSKPVLAAANVLQTIPSLALFGFLIPILGRRGIGELPAVIALFLYSLLPIIRNTFTGISGVDPGVREAARGMGMTGWQMLTMVELPLSSSMILAGVRVATVISVGTATIAAAIGAGGLGIFIFRGLRMNDSVSILAGAIPAALMALLVDFGLGLFEKKLAPGRGARPTSSRVLTRTVLGAAALALIGLFVFTNRSSPGRVVVGSKDFTEQVILGELLAQVIETRAGIQVERKFELSTDILHQAMVSGQIDVYPEYTGTAFTAILKHQPVSASQVVYDTVKQEYESRFGIEWLEPLGFNSTFAILVRKGDADRLSLKSISDAVPYAPKWHAAFGPDFTKRQDGYPGLARTYGLRFAAPPNEMDLALTYRALAGGQVDLIAGNSTDGMIDKLGLFQLQDDRHYFPPYDAAPLVRKVILDRYPQIGGAINTLAGKLTDQEMRRLNYAVDGDHRQPADVAREFLATFLAP